MGGELPGEDGSAYAVGEAAQAIKPKSCPVEHGLALCGNACVPVNENPKHCGGCGVVCPPGEVCSGGLCVAPGRRPVEHNSDFWYERGPMLGGRLGGIYSSADVGVLLAASPGGGVYKSTNGGVSWTDTQSWGLGDRTVVHLALDVRDWAPGLPERVYAVTWNGLYVTSDYGELWTALVGIGGSPTGLLPYPLPAYALSENPSIATTAADPSARAGLRPRAGPSRTGVRSGPALRARSAGAGGSANEDNCIGHIVADPVSRRLYIATLHLDWWGPARVFRNPAGCTWGENNQTCLQWEEAWGNPGLPECDPNQGEGELPYGRLVASLASASTVAKPDRLVAVMHNASPALTWVSENAGTCWKAMGTPMPGGDPRPLEFFGSAGYDELILGDVRSHYSNNLGATWQLFQSPQEHPDVRGLFARSGGLFTSNDGTMFGTNDNMVVWEFSPGQGTAPKYPWPLEHTGISAWQGYYATVVAGTGWAPGKRRVYRRDPLQQARVQNDAFLRGHHDRGQGPEGQPLVRGRQVRLRVLLGLGLQQPALRPVLQRVRAGRALRRRPVPAQVSSAPSVGFAVLGRAARSRVRRMAGAWGAGAGLRGRRDARARRRPQPAAAAVAAASGGPST
ncbi:MAG: hypothetical protein HY744_31270 [Deltaproteobacteria bacterium]|nr:hypothetical protein [Deltaproteobacteria bacterium]